MPIQHCNDCDDIESCMKKLPRRNIFRFTVYVEEYIYEEDIFYSERISHFHMSFISDDDAEAKRSIASRFDITPVP